MIEIQLFGWLLVTLPSALSVVLVLVAFTSVTYLAMTLAPVLGKGPASGRAARALGMATTAGVLLLSLVGLRVGAAGSGGEIVPTLALAVAASAASGAAAAFALLGAGSAAARLASSRLRKRAELAKVEARRTKQLQASERSFLEGEDIRAEVTGAESALDRLGAALDKLAATHARIDERLAALDDSARAGDLGRDLARTRDEVATRLDLGRRIQGAAAAAAFRLSCSAPLRRLLRRRPKDLTRDLTTAGTAPAAAKVGAAVHTIDTFLGEAESARTTLAALESRRFARPPTGDAADDDRDTSPEDAWALSMRDLAAIEGAYAAVQERLRVVAMRLDAQADMDAVATAAGEVSDKARAGGIGASDLQGLVDEVTRAESAIRMATPPELDARSLTEALARSTTALGGNDGASLDDLLRALREVA